MRVLSGARSGWFRVLILVALGLARSVDGLEQATAPVDNPEAESYEPLILGQKASGVIDWEKRLYVSFVVEVPDDAMVLALEVKDAPVDLDLFARFGEPILSYDEDAEFEASSRLYNDALRITRSGTPALRPGLYYVDVAYTLEAEPRIGKQRLERIPFSITASVIRSRVDGKLLPGVALSSETSAGSGWFRTFAIEVPEKAAALRIDLDQVTGDLDLVARRGEPVVDSEAGDHLAESMLGRETLLIDRDSEPPPLAGTWYLNVYDPFELDLVPFTAHVSFDAVPPAELLVIPRIRPPAEGIDRALLATVEVLTDAGNGSGTLISPDGWVLTNHHVVESDSGLPVGAGQLVVSLCLDPKQPPAELFRGSVVMADPELDLALVKIETGLYGQPLPAGYVFPYLELGNPEAVLIGDSVSILGYPGVGGLGSRATVSLTRGVISGFDSSEGGVIFKTDAEIGSGNSGGAALDRNWRLIGVPVGTVEDTEGYSQLGYILPLSRLPASWRQRIGR